eukprot:TRINITY_DN8634_c2_g1_i7.p1 TRINITY_DN8634_c2_g1~~TRINITY_DN8634_c2_g1_i7.p1  ORF type:complete len:295 (+),score=69.00 TRINITY_DN8634_c2_g1_i7:181-1065(+)
MDKDARIKQLEELLETNGIEIPEPVSKKRRVAEDETDYCKLPPFVKEYAPYTKGFSSGRKCIDPVAEAKKLWDMYYRQNQTEGFKDRHYLVREAPEALSAKVFMECGCGVGNALLPLKTELPNLNRIYGFDLSAVAVDLMKKDAKFDSDLITAFQHDMTASPLPSVVPDASVDFATLIFVLSAIAPEKMPASIAHLAQKISPGGTLYFRDYADGDLAQTRLASTPSSQIRDSDPSFFMRTCGTCAYFFTLDKAREIFSPWFDTNELQIVRRDITNQKQGITMHRVWMQGRFIRK